MVDIIIDLADELFKNKQFISFDSILTRVDIESCPTEVLVALIKCSFVAKSHLPSREMFVSNAKLSIANREEMREDAIERLR